MSDAREFFAHVPTTAIADVSVLLRLALIIEGLRPLLPLTAAYVAARRGVIAAVVDGAVRDVRALDVLGLPVWSRSVRPLVYTRRLECVPRDVPVTCGGVQVAPGDLIVADAGGVAVVPQGRAAEIRQRAAAVMAM